LKPTNLGKLRKFQPTNCIYEARALGFRPPGANAN